MVASTTTTALESSESLWSSVVSDVSETRSIGASHQRDQFWGTSRLSRLSNQAIRGPILEEGELRSSSTQPSWISGSAPELGKTSRSTCVLRRKRRQRPAFTGRSQAIGTARVGTGIAPEAVGSLAASDFRVDRAPIKSELLFAMREPPTPQGEAQRVDRGIGKGDAQRKRHRDPGDRLERSDGIHDVLWPILKG